MIKLPWTLSFILEWWPRMTLQSVLRLRRSETSETRDGELTLDLRSPIRGTVTLRTLGSDMATFEEVVKEQVYKPVLDHVSDCRTFVDLGANIGLASLYFATRFPKTKVIAVEPNDDTFNVLSKNLSQLPNAQLHKAAVWSRDTKLDGSFDRPDHFSAFQVHENGSGSLKGMMMQAILGDNEVDLLKIDIEGAETEVFKGDLSWLNQVKCIAIEFHDNSRAESNFDQIMSTNGFRVFEGQHTVIAVR